MCYPFKQNNWCFIHFWCESLAMITLFHHIFIKFNFDRRVAAIQFDVRHIESNAEQFNLPGSQIVRNARIVTEVCLEIIRYCSWKLSPHTCQLISPDNHTIDQVFLRYTCIFCLCIVLEIHVEIYIIAILAQGQFY